MSELPAHGATVAARMEAVTAELLSEVERLPPETLTWRPADGVWSVMDILCHIEEFVPYWTSQTAQIVESPDTEWGRDHTDEARLAAVENTASRRLGDVAAAIRDAVGNAAETLSSLSDSDLDVQARSRNPRWGVKPARFVVDHLLLEHLEKHLGQVRRNVSQHVP